MALIGPGATGLGRDHRPDADHGMVSTVAGGPRSASPALAARSRTTPRTRGDDPRPDRARLLGPARRGVHPGHRVAARDDDDQPDGGGGPSVGRVRSAGGSGPDRIGPGRWGVEAGTRSAAGPTTRWCRRLDGRGPRRGGRSPLLVGPGQRPSPAGGGGRRLDGSLDVDGLPRRPESSERPGPGGVDGAPVHTGSPARPGTGRRGGDPVRGGRTTESAADCRRKSVADRHFPAAPESTVAFRAYRVGSGWRGPNLPRLRP